ncbi:RNA polymerase sigma factor [Zhaonella formicivorans]|uniref:RNA polymerase sigma factor n=1 Tax=Zhaonella formicivorans TaxID=2528593 RepID=UPI0010E22C84|nr:sigma-70 family RNA polymerase sigma factor [Zhaonella formicivorans]
MQRFLKLYDQYFDDVYRYTYFKTGNSWDTEDLVSETFRKAFEKAHTIKGSPKAWIMTIARNTINDWYRKKKEIVTGDEDLDKYAYSYSFEEIFEQKEEMNCLKRSLQDLTKEELEIINLKYFSGLKHKEIGAMLGKSVDAIKMKSLRIIKKLGELVEKCMEG